MNQDNVIVNIGKKLGLNKLKCIIKFFQDIIFYKGLLWGKIVSIQDILAGNYPNVKILSCENVRLYYSPPVFNDGSGKKQELLEGKEYIQYAALIKNAIVYGDSNLIELSHHRVLFDQFSYDESKRYKYTNYNSKIFGTKGNCVFYWKGITHTLEKAIWMGGNFSWNYYHLLYEFSIKFLYLNALDISLNVPVLVDQRCLDVPQYKELLDIANKKGYELVGVNRQYRFQVRELIHISCPNLIPPHVKKGAQANDMQFNVNALCNLREYLLPYSSGREFPKRIFISRKNASRRRKFNEEAVMQLLLEFGFEAVFPEKLSVADQISLFNQAEWIIGGSGAAFTNLLFCNNLAKVIIISRAYFPFSGFSTIAAALGIYLLYLTEEDTNKNMIRGDIHDPFEIDLSYLKKQLVEFGLSF